MWISIDSNRRRRRSRHFTLTRSKHHNYETQHSLSTLFYRCLCRSYFSLSIAAVSSVYLLLINLQRLFIDCGVCLFHTFGSMAPYFRYSISHGSNHWKKLCDDSNGNHQAKQSASRMRGKKERNFDVFHCDVELININDIELLLLQTLQLNGSWNVPDFWWESYDCLHVNGHNECFCTLHRNITFERFLVFSFMMPAISR